MSLYVINILILYSQSATWFGSKFPGLQKMIPCIFVYIDNAVLEEFLTSFFGLYENRGNKILWTFGTFRTVYLASQLRRLESVSSGV